MINTVLASNISPQYQVEKWPDAFPVPDPRKSRSWSETAFGVAKTALRVITVLPTLHDFLRDLFRWIARLCIHPASIINNSGGRAAWRKYVETRAATHSQGVFNRLQLSTPDGAKLDATLYTPKILANKKLENLLIFTGGNASYYEYRLESAAERAERLGVPILLFNPRGVGDSPGISSPGGLALDVYAAYRFANDHLGVRPSRTLLHGWSLGGAYGNMGASLVQAEFPNEEMSVINDRSFSNLDKETTHLLGNGVFAWLARKILNWIDWKMDSQTAMNKLKGKKLIVHVKPGGDEIIPHAASLAEATRNTQANIRTLSLEPQVDSNNHCRNFTKNEEERIDAFVREVFQMPTPLKHLHSEIL